MAKGLTITGALATLGETLSGRASVGLRLRSGSCGCSRKGGGVLCKRNWQARAV